MAEWSKATVLKTVVRSRGPWVRIPLPPLNIKEHPKVFFYIFVLWYNLIKIINKNNMKYQTSNKHYRLLIFFVGIIATLAYRIIIILNYYSSLLVAISWYVGTIGFIWYFAHRYRVQNYHASLIREKKLTEKICKNNLTKDDCDALSYILKSTSSSKAKWNSIAIFILSAIALIYAVVFDIIKLIN